MEVQPKLQQAYKEVDNYVQSYQSLQKENMNIQKEVKILQYKNNQLQKEKDNLISYLKAILRAIKAFFRKLLLTGNEKTKDTTTKEIKQYYDNDDFTKNDVYDIARETTKEDELLNYIDYDYYYDKDDFSI